MEVVVHGERNEEAKQTRLERGYVTEAAGAVLARADTPAGAQRADLGGVLSRGVACAIGVPVVAREVEASRGKAWGPAIPSGQWEMILQEGVEYFRPGGSDSDKRGKDGRRVVESGPARGSADYRGSAV